MVVIRLCLDVGLQGNGKGESENWAGLGLIHPLDLQGPFFQ